MKKANEIEEEFQESVRKREEAGLEETQELTVYPVLEILNRINQFLRSGIYRAGRKMQGVKDPGNRLYSDEGCQSV